MKTIQPTKCLLCGRKSANWHDTMSRTIHLKIEHRVSNKDFQEKLIMTAFYNRDLDEVEKK